MSLEPTPTGFLHKINFQCHRWLDIARNMLNTVVDDLDTHEALSDWDAHGSTAANGVTTANVASNNTHRTTTDWDAHGSTTAGDATVAGTLTVDTDMNATGDVSGTNGTFTATVSGVDGDFSGDMDVDGHAAFGATGSIGTSRVVTVSETFDAPGVSNKKGMLFSVEITGSSSAGHQAVDGSIEADGSTNNTGSIVGGSFGATNALSGATLSAGYASQAAFIQTSGTTTEAAGYRTSHVKISGTCTDLVDFWSSGFLLNVGGTVTNHYGFRHDKASAATNEYGGWMNGYGTTSDWGAAWVFGTSKEHALWGDANDLVADVGTRFRVTKEIELDGDLNHDGSNVGFYGVAPTARPAAYTQTYSTATRTHSNPTAAALTDSSGGTADQTVSAVSGSGADTTINNNFAEMADEINKLVTDLANTKQVLNQVIDDLQSNGLLQ